MSKTKKPQIPLNTMLSAMDRNQLDFYANLDPELKEVFSPWMAMRYASSSTTDAEHHLLMVNGLVNTDFNSLRKHPELQWKLLAVCGTGRSCRHPWIPPGRRGAKNKRVAFLREIYSAAKDQDLELSAQLLTREQLHELAEANGMTDKDIKELLK